MALEIERKFLVINDKWKDSVISEAVIKQGYLATTDHATVRVRVDGDEANINIKGRTVGISRREYEYPIPLEEAEELLKHLVSGAAIDKVRYKVRCGDHIWDLDLFHGANQGLVMAEVELSREDEAFVMPEWAGEEVSGDTRYYNANLVKHPFCEW
ncbi:MAG: CYTH domain-containing protein [Candidatus Thiodiazotropha lotti]|uniref:CYTH domain-containing protein n=1 Tax=Candidatus Thiodiazotropha lotti TaxID=2792787 RepID=A0A9E4K212_9GAMM|nr:CYTH domain-containing protein [Candidatus Thiodiazotropha lotti]ODB99152.1 adenylate cyclase [Candidatus Thiodiazotropha endoloripes]MCG7921133.1 CYTH domain-containing protein [Candidatus Thiodiazotropha lotti]MCG7929149.1 CYTH domain-containing protein [Candidatus Thiodiazotropha lotti]MCG7937304.1 CYTH domain-containing protein [Candidatus Thiodiazotropha lotti]